MEGDDQRRRHTGDNVKIKPVLGGTFLAQPTYALAQGIQEDDEKQADTNYAEFDSKATTGFQKGVFCGKWALQATECVVIKTVDRQKNDHSDRDSRTEIHQQHVRALTVVRLGVGIACETYIRTHCLSESFDLVSFATETSVSTVNRW